MKIIILISFSLFISACNSTKISAPNDYLFKTWVDSREENSVNSSTRIFRPSAFKTFPASRFRMKYTFHKDGTCSYLWLSPIDAHSIKPCLYKYKKGSIQLFDTNKQKLETLTVLAFSSDKLIIKR